MDAGHRTVARLVKFSKERVAVARDWNVFATSHPM